MSLDVFLSWVVIFTPVVLGVILILVPSKKDDPQGHMAWRYILGACLIVFGALVWWQQQRMANAATKDRESAIRETSTRVSADVTRAVTGQFKETIADQSNQIADLKNQLAEQSKDVKLIKGSNIVTGKNPVKVEMANTAPNITLLHFGPTNPNTRVAAHEDTIQVLTDKSISPVRAFVECEGGLEAVLPTVFGSSIMAVDGGKKLSPKRISFGIDSPPWTVKSPLFLYVYYNEETLGSCSVGLE